MFENLDFLVEYSKSPGSETSVESLYSIGPGPVRVRVKKISGPGNAIRFG